MLDKAGNANVETAKKDTPVEISFNLGRCALTIKSTCGECIHHKRMAYPAYKKVCVELGIIEENKPCPAFSPNTDRVKFTESKHARNVARAISDFSPRELKNLAAILNQEERTRRYGFKLGQELYFLAFGGDYLSNYLKAYVVSADSTYVHLEGEKGCLISLHHNSVLNKRKWERKQIQLLSANKQVDPNYKKYTQNMTKSEKNIKSIIDKTIATLSPDTKQSNALSSSSPKKHRNERHMDLTELLSVSTR